jgi:transposase InsO family protein
MLEGRKYRLTSILKVVSLSRSTYYYESKKADWDDKNKGQVASIQEIFKAHKQNYGVRRVYHELANQGVKVNHKKVQRIMKKLGLSAKKHPQKYHSYQGHIGAVADNHLKRDFKVITPNKKMDNGCVPVLVFVGKMLFQSDSRYV